MFGFGGSFGSGFGSSSDKRKNKQQKSPMDTMGQTRKANNSNPMPGMGDNRSKSSSPNTGNRTATPQTMPTLPSFSGQAENKKPSTSTPHLSNLAAQPWPPKPAQPQSLPSTSLPKMATATPPRQNNGMARAATTPKTYLGHQFPNTPAGRKGEETLARVRGLSKQQSAPPANNGTTRPATPQKTYLGHQFPNTPAGRKGEETLARVRGASRPSPTPAKQPLSQNSNPARIPAPAAPSQQAAPQTPPQKDIAVPEGVHNPGLYKELHEKLGWGEQQAAAAQESKPQTTPAAPKNGSTSADMERKTYLGHQFPNTPAGRKGEETMTRVLEDGAPTEVRERMGYQPDYSDNTKTREFIQKSFDDSFGDGTYTVLPAGKDGEHSFRNNKTGRVLPVNDRGWSIDDAREKLPNAGVSLAGSALGTVQGAAGSLANPIAGMALYSAGAGKATYLAETYRLVHGRKLGYHDLSNKEIHQHATDKAAEAAFHGGTMKTAKGTVKHYWNKYRKRKP